MSTSVVEALPLIQALPEDHRNRLREIAKAVKADPNATFDETVLSEIDPKLADFVRASIEKARTEAAASASA